MSGRPQSPETRAKIAASLRGWCSDKQRANLDRIRARVVWDADMDTVLARGVQHGVGFRLLAEEIGVAELTARRRADALELPRRRRAA